MLSPWKTKKNTLYILVTLLNKSIRFDIILSKLCFIHINYYPSMYLLCHSFKKSLRIFGIGNSSNLSLSFTHLSTSVLQISSNVPTVE